MSWLPIIALATAAFLVAAFVLRIERSSWTLLGAVLVFGLAGYAWQGSPEQPAAPKPPSVSANDSGEAVVAARRSLFDTGMPPADYLILSDAFARRGDYETAAGILKGRLDNNPVHGEGWLALGNALVEHAGGNVTPAAAEAYARAEEAIPGHPGPSFFLGAALLRSGDLRGARGVWQRLLDSSPDDAPWNDELRARIERMDQLIAELEGRSAPQ